MLSSCVMSEVDAAPLLKKQRTLSRVVEAKGIGVFTGETVTIRLMPSAAHQGIVFRRMDLPGSPQLPAHLDYVQGTPRCTMIGDRGVYVYTVEHLLAALKAYDINQAVIEISGSEVPIFDGSSVRFVQMIQEAGVVELEATSPVYSISTPVFWSEGNIQLMALPAEEYRISYTLHYPQSPLIGTQFYSVTVDAKSFDQDIAPCRTFSVYEEIAPLIERGLIRGGSLESAVVIRNNQVANPEGLRFADEMVRHKILDLIGDLSLIPDHFKGHVIAIRSGHHSNNAFARVLYNHIKMENS